MAYTAQSGTKQLVIVDGQAGAEYDHIEKGSPIFSPDNKRVAYAVRNETKQLVIVDGLDGHAGGAYAAVADLI